MMRPDAHLQTDDHYPPPVDFRTAINGLAALVAGGSSAGDAPPASWR